MMKLMSLTEATKSVKDQQALDIARCGEIRDVLKRYETRMVQAENSFQKKLATQRDIWEQETQEVKDMRNTILQDIEQLELRRKQLLIPLIDREEMIKSKEEELEAMKKKLQSALKDAGDVEVVLHEKLDEVGERELALKDREIRVSLMEDGAKRQAQSVRLQVKALSEEITKFSLERDNIK